MQHLFTLFLTVAPISTVHKSSQKLSLIYTLLFRCVFPKLCFIVVHLATFNSELSIFSILNTSYLYTSKCTKKCTQGLHPFLLESTSYLVACTCLPKRGFYWSVYLFPMLTYPSIRVDLLMGLYRRSICLIYCVYFPFHVHILTLTTLLSNIVVVPSGPHSH